MSTGWAIFFGLGVIGFIVGAVFLIPKYFNSEMYRRKQILYARQMLRSAPQDDETKQLIAAAETEIRSWEGKPYNPFSPTNPPSS